MTACLTSAVCGLTGQVKAAFALEEEYEWGDAKSFSSLSPNQILWSEAGRMWRLASQGQGQDQGRSQGQGLARIDMDEDQLELKTVREPFSPFSLINAVIFGKTLPPPETLYRMVISGGGKAVIIADYKSIVNNNNNDNDDINNSSDNDNDNKNNNNNNNNNNSNNDSNNNTNSNNNNNNNNNSNNDNNLMSIDNSNEKVAVKESNKNLQLTEIKAHKIGKKNNLESPNTIGKKRNISKILSNDDENDIIRKSFIFNQSQVKNINIIIAPRKDNSNYEEQLKFSFFLKSNFISIPWALPSFLLDYLCEKKTITSSLSPSILYFSDTVSMSVLPSDFSPPFVPSYSPSLPLSLPHSSAQIPTKPSDRPSQEISQEPHTKKTKKISRKKSYFS